MPNGNYVCSYSWHITMPSKFFQWLQINPSTCLFSTTASIFFHLISEQDGIGSYRLKKKEEEISYFIVTVQQDDGWMVEWRAGGEAEACTERQQAED